ncbi:MAG: efflux RND transporter permease subunit [Steroidobacteraceae bacterium]
MAARNVAASDVYNALAANNYLTAVGSTKGQMVSVDLTADTDLHSLDGFRKLIVRQQNSTVVRLEDVATVELGAEDYDSGVTWNGRHSVFLAVQNSPKANVLQVAQAVRDALPAIQAQLPSGMRAEIVYDTTMFVRSAIREVVKTLVEALLIVTVVIFLFLGSVRGDGHSGRWPCHCR